MLLSIDKNGSVIEEGCGDGFPRGFRKKARVSFQWVILAFLQAAE
jgi:hypothetical protein